jgi:hypothetical protein
MRIGYTGHWGKARDLLYSCSKYLRLNNALLIRFGGEVGQGAAYWAKIRGTYWDKMRTLVEARIR